MNNFEKYGDSSVVAFRDKGHGISFGGNVMEALLKEYHKWLTSTAAPTLTPEERKIVEVLQVLGFTEWLARDKNGRLWSYRKRPSRKGEQWEGHGHFGFSENTNSLFPFIQWTDTEPTKISDLLEV